MCVCVCACVCVFKCMCVQQHIPFSSGRYVYRLMDYDTEYCFSARTRFNSMLIECQPSTWHCIKTPHGTVCMCVYWCVWVCKNWLSVMFRGWLKGMLLNRKGGETTIKNIYSPQKCDCNLLVFMSTLKGFFLCFPASLNLNAQACHVPFSKLSILVMQDTVYIGSDQL